MRFIRTGAAAIVARLVRLGRIARARSPSARSRRLTQAALLARSVERDTLLLLRLPRDQARRLAAAATTSRRPPAATIAAATRFLSIDAILGDRITAPSSGADAPGHASRRENLGRLLAELALERTGVEGLAVLAAAELGPDGIGRCAPSLRDALIDKAIREAAASRRARPVPGAAATLPDELCVRSLGAIAAVLRDDGALPLAARPVPRIGRASLARGALADWRDLSAVLSFVVAGEAGRWQAGRNAAAFSLLWTLPDTLDALSSAEADAIRRDAEHAARLVLRQGGGRAAEAARVVLVASAAFVPA